MFITDPNDDQLDELRRSLSDLAPELEEPGAWPARQLEMCAEAGVFRWFVPREWGGEDWDPADVAAGYLKLSKGCLTTTFIITQYTGAARRIAGSDNNVMKQKWLAGLCHGDVFGTVGISHLTTSRRHLKRPVLLATACSGGYRLQGMAPWVTGAPHADAVVVGATLENGQQILATVDMDLNGVKVAPSATLTALTASQTGPLEFDDCFIDKDCILDGPTEEVMKRGIGASTGGAQTSTLAVGLADAAIDYLLAEASHRHELAEAAQAFSEESQSLAAMLLRAAGGDATCSKEDLRAHANSLVLRSTQAALSAAKGAGYVSGHPVGRWCREALFFLVWSCPQPVISANLCELAGLTE